MNRAPRPPAPGAGNGTDSAVAALLQSLHAESRALTAGDVDALAQAVTLKEHALRQLAAGAGATRPAALREAVRRARELNERNARLLMPHLMVNRARIETLFGGAIQGGVYSSDGREAGPRSLPGQRGVRA